MSLSAALCPSRGLFFLSKLGFELIPQMSIGVAQGIGHRAEVVICQSPPVLQWAVSLMAGSQREAPETLRRGKDRMRECSFYLFNSRTCECNFKIQTHIKENNL